jgi:hypothetical protein
VVVGLCSSNRYTSLLLLLLLLLLLVRLVRLVRLLLRRLLLLLLLLRLLLLLFSSFTYSRKELRRDLLLVDLAHHVLRDLLNLQQPRRDPIRRNTLPEPACGHTKTSRVSSELRCLSRACLGK